MKTKALALSLAATVLLSGCGQVADTGSNIPDNTKGNAADANSAVATDIQESETQNDDDAYYEDMLAQLNGLSFFYDNAIQDCNENNTDVAKLVLEAVAQPGTQEQEVDTSIYYMTIEDFQLVLEFENVVEFKVGDVTISGNMLTIINSEDCYYFEVDTFDTEQSTTKTGSAVMFDESYIPKIIEAAGIDAEGEPTNEPEDTEFDEYVNNILENGFGFELYNDGHTDSWEKRYDVARLLLEAIAQPGTEFDQVDAAIGEMDLNAKETEGFMTWLKFENEVTFKVGDATHTGSMLMVVEDDGHYYFDITNGEHNTGMTIFDESYIPKILEAASAEVPDDDLDNRTAPTTAIEEVYDDADFSKANLLIMTGDSESVEITDNDDKNAIIKAVLVELTVTFIESDEVWLDRNKYMGKESSIYLMFDLGEPTNIWVGNDVEQDVYVVALIGNDEDGYLIQVDNETVYELDPEVIQQVRLRACD